MDPNALPFDAEAMLAGLRPWVECESPTFDAAAVKRMMDLAARDLALPARGSSASPAAWASATACARPSRTPTPHAPGILVMGHLDTVHPIGTLAHLPVPPRRRPRLRPRHLRHEGRQLLSLEAIRQLAARRHRRRKLPVTVLFTSDEEVGSPSTRDLIEAEAARHNYVLVPGARAPRWRRGDRPLRHRPLQPGSDRPAQPRRRAARRRPQRDPRDGAPADRDRGDDHRRLHLQRRRDPRRAVGELRRHHLHRRGAVAWPSGRRTSTAAWSACWRCAAQPTTCSSA